MFMQNNKYGSADITTKTALFFYLWEGFMNKTYSSLLVNMCKRPLIKPYT